MNYNVIPVIFSYNNNLVKLSVVLLAHLYENQAERNIERILMEAITQTTYTLRIFISKRKDVLFPS